VAEEDAVTLTCTFGRLTTTLSSLTFRRALDERGRRHAPHLPWPLLLLRHGRCCCSPPLSIQCSTADALLPAARMPSRPSRCSPRPLSPPREQARPRARESLPRPPRRRAGRSDRRLGGACPGHHAVARGRGELRPGRRRERDSGELAPSRRRREHERGHHDVLIDGISARIDLAARGTTTRRRWVRREVALSSLVPRASTGWARLQKNES
jgi:hypothetical protein